MAIFPRFARLLAVASVCCLAIAGAQEAASNEELPIERCDVLPVVTVKVSGKDMRFLLDTAATTILNLNSFKTGVSKEIRVDSWQGQAATSAREVSLPELKLGTHELRDLKLPAIDLSPIGKACGGNIDGILGVDLLDRLGVTIDLKRRVAVFEKPQTDPKVVYAAMEKSMHACNDAFNTGSAASLEDCFDPDIVLYTPHGEFRGREQVMRYLNDRYLKFAPNIRFDMQPHDVRTFGEALWYSYDYTIEAPDQHLAGHGMAMCRRQNGKWRVLNMHNSLREASEAKPQ